MPGLVVHLIPHTHWDREWYLTRAGFLARLVPMLDDLLERLEQDPAFRSFLLDGQTVLLEDYLRVRPERRERVAALVGAGRLQTGPWYVLADELIPSGESLVRNLLAGSADCARLGGRLDVLYSPDAFGHPAILPTLAAEFGIGSAVLWRGLGGERGQQGDLYRWRGPDGAEIVVYHLPPDGYEVGAALPAGWSSLREVLVSRARTPHVAVPVGADHHAAHPAIASVREAIAAEEPGAEVRISRLDEFLGEAASATGELPSLEGELRWSYGYTWTLQGVHGTRAALKRKHALAEVALERVAEPLAALALARGARDGRALLGEAWRTLLRSQFHDSIAGCTSDPVARRVEARIEDAATLAAEVARGCFDALLGNDPDLARERPDEAAPSLVVWNPAARARSGVVAVDLTWLRRDVLVGPPGGRTPRVAAAPGEADIAAAVGGWPYQLLGRAVGAERLDAPRHYPDQDEVEVIRVAVALPRVGGLGFELANGGPVREPPRAAVAVSGRRLENGLLRVEVAGDGRVALTDLATGARYGGLFALESEGDIGDAYTWAAPAGDSVRRPAGRAAIATVARGPLVGAIEVRLALAAGRAMEGDGAGRVEVRLTLSLQAGSAALRCTLEVDNRACDHRLRLRFPGVARAAKVVAGGPFGAVARTPTAAEPAAYPRETPVATAPAHRFVLGGGAAGGLALLAPGFFEYEHTAAGDLLLTVLRAFGQLSRADLPSRPGHAAWPVATPLAQSLGRERMQLAVQPLPPSAAADAAAAGAAWEDVFLPPRPVWLRQATRLSPPPGELTLEGTGLVLSAIKPAAEGERLVLRCYNASDAEVEGRWRLPFAATAAWLVRADERELESLAPEDAGRSIPFRAAPRGIATVALEVSR